MYKYLANVSLIGDELWCWVHKDITVYYDPREANRYRDHETERLVEIVSPDYHELESHFGGTNYDMFVSEYRIIKIIK